MECNFLYSKDVKFLSISDCKSKFNERIINYIQDKSCFLATSESLNKRKEFIFGINNHYSKKSEIEENWQITNTIVKENRAFIFAEIRKIRVLIINDYSRNSLIWFYFNHKMIGNEIVFTKMLDQKRFFVIQFKKKGISITDVTHSYDLEISSSHLHTLDNIELFLDNQKIFEIDVKFWDG